MKDKAVLVELKEAGREERLKSVRRTEVGIRERWSEAQEGVEIIQGNK